jgi:hypothetical protein
LPLRVATESLCSLLSEARPGRAHYGEEDARMATITMVQAVEAYRAANNRGEGYAPYTDEAGEDTIDEAIACAERDGWSLLLERHTSDDVAVLRNGDGEHMAIGGDAMGRGAWAVSLAV